MLNAIKSFFNTHLATTSDPVSNEHQVRLAAAALMMEVARADFQIDASELAHIERILVETLRLDADEVAELVRLAEQESHDATSMHAFTRLVNDRYAHDDKVELFLHLWRVAYADGRLDKYEEYTLRKIADLLYLPHRDFIQTKHRALESR